MTSLGSFIANTLTDQQTRATGHRPYKPEIPGDHRCPQGACTLPPPPPPVTNNPESFTSQYIQPPIFPLAYWALIASLTVTLVLIRATSK